MPKDEPSLTEDEVKTLADWIAGGRPGPKAGGLAYSPKRDLDWWSLKPIQEGLVSERNPSPGGIPSTISSTKNSREGTEATWQRRSATLVRRLSYDLTGLPPAKSSVNSHQ